MKNRRKLKRHLEHPDYPTTRFSTPLTLCDRDDTTRVSKDITKVTCRFCKIRWHKRMTAKPKDTIT